MREQQALAAIEMLAATITCDRELMAVLKDAKPDLRESVYKQIKPFVGYPDPRRFDLMTFEDA